MHTPLRVRTTVRRFLLLGNEHTVGRHFGWWPTVLFLGSCCCPVQAVKLNTARASPLYLRGPDRVAMAEQMEKLPAFQSEVRTDSPGREGAMTRRPVAMQE